MPGPVMAMLEEDERVPERRKSFLTLSKLAQCNAVTTLETGEQFTPVVLSDDDATA
jgi:hypothetical protein